MQNSIIKFFVGSHCVAYHTETDSPDFIENWVNKLKFKQKNFEELARLPESEQKDTIEWEYTDVVIIGGDGLLNQYLNACYKRNKNLLKIPIGILPGGCGNALS